MIHGPHVDWFLLAPSNALLASAALSLLTAVLVPRGGRRFFGSLWCGAGFLASFILAALLYWKSGTPHPEIAGAVVRDRFGALAQMIVAGAGFLTVLISWGERMRDDHIAEYYALLAAAGAGMSFLAISNDLMTLFLALEWFSIALYILCAIDIDLVGSLEAGLKYLIVGSFGSAALLFGSALVYGATGELGFGKIAQAISAQGLRGDGLLVLGLAMLIAGFGFKSSAAPFHMWTPDVY
ncbi:MAG: NADH-quinone oxidoreductase subunit, partial [Gaiellaceae bacterium]|nr:NADH-quinone oxidoreductase subunit [Gaiellaceae bacterium]